MIQTDTHNHRIAVHLCHNRYCFDMIQGRVSEDTRVLIWKAEGITILFAYNKNCRVVADALKLRRSHRIVGNFVGALPCQPHQDIWLGLPLELLPEETTLLLEQGIVFGYCNVILAEGAL